MNNALTMVTSGIHVMDQDESFFRVPSRCLLSVVGNECFNATWWARYQSNYIPQAVLNRRFWVSHSRKTRTRYTSLAQKYGFRGRVLWGFGKLRVRAVKTKKTSTSVVTTPCPVLRTLD